MMEKAKRKVSKSKKAALKKLPSTWRDDVWEKASTQDWRTSRPQLLPALAILSVIACRPAEINVGVRIACRSDGLLMIEVKGAKCVDAGDRERGQPVRTYSFRLKDGDHPSLLYLRDLAASGPASGNGDVHMITVRHDAGYLYNSVVALGQATYPTLRTRISPYVFRHQKASDLKADPDVSLEEAAAFMGHLSDYSIGKYGHATHGKKRGSGNVKPLAVKTSRPIKHSEKVDRLARFKAASVAKRKQQLKMR